ncbi:hypothetical protein [Amaricoccus solimangrovi]|uniref:NADH:ubiquinone oxidoreductase n=1 Tax=Amaricoccus solimangrovi TaxID=2589815 RepID=A0A501WZI9_9RHOB|nr:hypothetical protein [Amaricoccus solimangrovi]TPE53874.1 hypothetical protein FJM51_02165 [Amaricoccus solimangrovi]
MSEKDFRKDFPGPAFWLAAGVGSAMLASQLALRVMRAMHQASAPSRVMMKGPFGAAGWMFGAPEEAPKPAAEAPGKAPSRARADVSDAEVVERTRDVVPTPAEVVADAAAVMEPLVEATRETLDIVSETLGSVTPEAPTGGIVAGEPAALAEALEPETPEPETLEPEAPVAEAPAPEAAPEAEAAPVHPERPTALAAPEGAADDLKKIKGVGPKLEGVLNGLGYFHFAQIAAWGPEELRAVDESLGGFSGRATRDDWIAQARLLGSDAGDGAGD